jgi:SulP family sulfate permease
VAKRQRDGVALLKQYLPAAEWLPTYERKWLSGDLIAALTVWALLVPEAMAYASLAGLPPEAGLYAAPLALVGYALFGSSRQLIVGPSSTVAVLSVVMVAPLAGGDTALFIALSAGLAIAAGLVAIVLGVLKAGAIKDFMSAPVLAGFLIGLAITIVVGQLDKILGYSVETDAGVFRELVLLLRDIGNLHAATFVVGAASLAVLFALGKWAPKVPGALAVVVLSIVAVSLFNLEDAGVHIIGEIPGGLPPFGWPDGLTLSALASLLPSALAITIVGFAEGIAAAESYAEKHKYAIDPNSELIGLGAANLGAGLSGGFVVDGSLSKSAAADDAGQHTQMASLINAALVLVTAVFLTPLFHNLAEATLGAIVIHAVYKLISFGKLKTYWRVKRRDFWAALIALLGVISIGILFGLMLAVLVSLVAILGRVSRPDSATLGRVTGRSGEEVFLDQDEYDEAQTIPGLLIYRFGGMLFFADAGPFRTELKPLAEAAEPPVKVVLVDAEQMNDIDVTGVETLQKVVEDLEQLGAQLWMARVKVRVRETMRKAGLEDIIGKEHFYLSVRAGADAFANATPVRGEEERESEGPGDSKPDVD